MVFTIVRVVISKYVKKKGVDSDKIFLTIFDCINFK